MRRKETVPNRAVLKDGRLWLYVYERGMETTKNLADVPKCKYHLKTGVYELPLTWGNVRLLEEWEFIFSKSLRDWQRIERQERDVRNLKIKNIKGLPHDLHPYQLRGVSWIDECGGRALIADEMGLGKTVQALAWCHMHTKKRPVLVVCPSILKINWEREAEKWVKDAQVQVLEGRTTYKITGNFVVINYDILDWWKNDLKWYGFEVLLCDEAHYIKNDKSKRTKAFKTVAKQINNIVALTGTPIENRPIEIYNIVHVLDPTLFPDRWRFAKQFCDLKAGEYGGVDMSGSSNEQKLHRILTKTVMLRRKKSEVLTDLPPKRVSVLPLEINNRKEYREAEGRFIRYLQKKFDDDLLTKEGIEKELKRYAKEHDLKVGEELSAKDIKHIKQTKVEKAQAAPVLVQMGQLKQLAVKGKMEAACEWIKGVLEKDEKLVVFGVNRLVIDWLMKEFKDVAVRVDGSVTTKQRQRAVDRFQNDPTCRLFVGNIDAAGVGLTLTAASNVAIIQFPWTPTKLSQAADRVHRITQTKEVTVWNLVGVNTIEEKILKVLQEKEKTIVDILDGGNYDGMSIALEIAKKYKIVA